VLEDVTNVCRGVGMAKLGRDGGRRRGVGRRDMLWKMDRKRKSISDENSKRKG
jgi:hypothetical protein